MSQERIKDEIICKVDYPYIWEDYQTGMIQNNQIPYLLKCEVSVFDGITRFHFDISSKISFRRFCEEEKIGEKHLDHFLAGLRKALKEIEAYLLDEQCLILDPKYIYLDKSTGDPYFCYIPGYEQDIGAALHRLSEFFVKHADHKDRAFLTIVYELYRLSMEKDISIEEAVCEAAKKERNLQEVPAEKTEREEKEPDEKNSREEETESDLEIRNYRKECLLAAAIMCILFILRILYIGIDRIDVTKTGGVIAAVAAAFALVCRKIGFIH